MTGPKLNEKSFVAGERSGTKAQAKYVRSSASKARAVLDLIRGLDVTSADEVLRFTDRHIAHDVRKVLASAVANAINNDGQDASELFVIACFADEGPTLRRFRPRARGRATRINKRTCHITIVVARMSDDRIAIVQARQERQGGSAASGRPKRPASSRAARVARSQAKDAATESDSTDADTLDADAAAEYAAGDADSDGEVNAVDASPHGEGSHAPLDDVDEAPEGFSIKGNAQSMLYHEPESRYYAATKAEVWFDSVESAEAAGFSKPGAKKEEAADTESTTTEDNVAADEAEES
ncbi:MAG: 50S ribosomal protein L22 [Ilumatobacter sp.]|jgi:large subunit ribosomal protein L22|uniref:50S ribosomal protein L22 n=1 Tax=Ilumatobacter sp. TaxID=1967498 RepID=UPI003918759F